MLHRVARDSTSHGSHLRPSCSVGVLPGQQCPSSVCGWCLERKLWHCQWQSVPHIRSPWVATLRCWCLWQTGPCLRAQHAEETGPRVLTSDERRAQRHSSCTHLCIVAFLLWVGEHHPSQGCWKAVAHLPTRDYVKWHLDIMQRFLCQCILFTVLHHYVFQSVIHKLQVPRGRCVSMFINIQMPPRLGYMICEWATLQCQSPGQISPLSPALSERPVDVLMVCWQRTERKCSMGETGEVGQNKRSWLGNQSEPMGAPNKLKKRYQGFSMSFQFMPS